MKKHLGILALLSVGLAAFFLSCMITEKGGTMPPAVTVKIARAGGIPISPFAFGNNYYNWVDWKKNGQTALPGTTVTPTPRNSSTRRRWTSTSYTAGPWGQSPS
jgi:hypothetical protein